MVFRLFLCFVLFFCFVFFVFFFVGINKIYKQRTCEVSYQFFYKIMFPTYTRPECGLISIPLQFKMLVNRV